MTDALLLGIITVGGGMVGTYFAQRLREINENKRTQITASTDAHKAETDLQKAELEGDAQFMERLLERVKDLEDYRAESEKNSREQDRQIARLERALDRVGAQYETNRKLQRRVARLLREDKAVDEDTVYELDNAPEFSRVLDSPTAAAPLPPVS